MVFIPYCTGDVFIGSGPRDYSYANSTGEEVRYTAFHNGYENSMEIIEWIYRNFQTPDKIVM